MKRISSEKAGGTKGLKRDEVIRFRLLRYVGIIL